MKRPSLTSTAAITACVAALSLGCYFWANAKRTPTTMDDAAPEPVATVTTTLPVAANALRDVLAYGDIAPSKTQSVSFSRPGQLAELNVVAGQRVARGGPLARIVGDPVAEAAVVQARSASTLADAELKRVEQMQSLQLATNSQVDTARKAAQDAHSILLAQQKLGTGDAAVQALAPFDGVVLSLAASAGDRLAAGAPVLQFGRTDKLRVSLGIEPAQRVSVRIGEAVKLAPLGSTGTTAPMADGQVASVQDIVDPRSQLLNAMVDIAPGPGAAALVPGMRVIARIQTGSEPGWSVPRPAVLSDDRGAYVYQVSGNVARRVAVQTLFEGADTLVVKGELSAQVPIVSVGNYELADGMKIAGTKR